MRPGFGHRVVGVGSGEHSSRQVELGVLRSAVVAVAIRALVVTAGNVGELSQHRATREDALGEVGVQAHTLPLLGRERTVAVPDARRHTDPPDVVHECGPSHRGGVVIGQSCGAARVRGEVADARGVRAQPRRLQVDELRDRAECVVEVVGLDRDDRCGLRVQHPCAEVVAALGEPRLALCDQDVHDRRVVALPAAIDECVSCGWPIQRRDRRAPRRVPRRRCARRLAPHRPPSPRDDLCRRTARSRGRARGGCRRSARAFPPSARRPRSGQPSCARARPDRRGHGRRGRRVESTACPPRGARRSAVSPHHATP